MDRGSSDRSLFWNDAPRHLIRDRDRAFGTAYTQRIRAMGIRDHPVAARSPWQNGHVERLIGSVRRECPDHLLVSGRLRGAPLSKDAVFLEFLLNDELDSAANSLPHQLFQRAFPLPSAPAIPLHSVILRYPPASGCELWLNSPDLDAFLLFHQLPDTASRSSRRSDSRSFRR